MKPNISRSLVTPLDPRPRRGEVQCRRAELSIGEALRRRRFVTARAWMPGPRAA